MTDLRWPTRYFVRWPTSLQDLTLTLSFLKHLYHKQSILWCSALYHFLNHEVCGSNSVGSHCSFQTGSHWFEAGSHGFEDLKAGDGKQEWKDEKQNLTWWLMWMFVLTIDCITVCSRNNKKSTPVEMLTLKKVFYGTSQLFQNLSLKTWFYAFEIA